MFFLFFLHFFHFYFVDSSQQFYIGPYNKSPKVFDAWWSSYQSYLNTTTSNLNLSVYDLNELKWARTSYVQIQAMIHDRYLYDRDANEWKVDKFLHDLNERYGGINSVLLWPGYPNIGIDDRNQFDMIENVPGGINGLKQLIEDFHKAGVHVLLPYYPWDQYTRRLNMTDWHKAASLFTLVNVDGFNGDTMDGVNASYWDETVKFNHPLAIEPEMMNAGYRNIQYNVMSWNYWTNSALLRASSFITNRILGLRYDAAAPPVSVYKAMTKGRHMAHIVERWATDRTDGLQFAFFNGVGYEAWENVWGIWNQLTERDASATKRIYSIIRRFGDFLQGGSEWIPHIPILQEESLVFTSLFYNQSMRIWLIVNRDKENDKILNMKLDCINDKTLWYDLYHGLLLKQSPCINGSIEFSLEIESSGFGAIMSSEDQINLKEFLDLMANLTSIPLKNLSSQWNYSPQTLLSTSNSREIPLKKNDNLILIPGGDYLFTVAGNCIEGDRLPQGVDVQFPWEEHPQRSHKQLLKIKPFYMDKYPITNKDYFDFLTDSDYKPKNLENWLKDWKNGIYLKGYSKKPVVWVSYEDAIVYCNYYGKRLPNSWEWQWAAQGNDSRFIQEHTYIIINFYYINRLWPWGSTFDSSKVPLFTYNRTMPPADDVDAHPEGASWAGINDMVGNIYQWTDIFTDEHTARAVIRGGSHWRPGNDPNSWYLPNPKNLNEHNTFLLIGGGLDRSAGIGFRCAADGKIN